jgi:hypothetical protein
MAGELVGALGGTRARYGMPGVWMWMSMAVMNGTPGMDMDDDGHGVHNDEPHDGYAR